MSHATALAVSDRIDPTPERLRRGDLQRRDVQFPGVTDVADVFQAERATMLDHMLETGEISDRQHAAGEVYQRLCLLSGRVRARAGATARLTELRGRNGQSDRSAAAEMACFQLERAIGRENRGDILWLNALCLDDQRINQELARRVLDRLANLLRPECRSRAPRPVEAVIDDVRAYRSASPGPERPSATGEGWHGR